MTLEFKITFDPDEKGYFERECPHTNCEYEFKVLLNDWNTHIQSAAFCPKCKHKDNPNAWWTKDQLKHMEKIKNEQIGHEVKKLLSDFSKNLEKGMSKIPGICYSSQLKNPGKKPTAFPYKTKEEITIYSQCEECAFKYGYVGLAVFCPSCGHNSIMELFDQSIKKISQSIQVEEKIRPVLSLDECKTVMETLYVKAILDSVTAFQYLTENLFKIAHPDINVRRNIFQNFDEGSKLWLTHRGNAFEDFLEKEEVETLKKYFQQRHILSHCEGIIDEGYLKKSGDTSLKIGQRIVIKIHNATECINLIEKLIGHLR